MMWRQKIVEARNRGYFSDEDRKLAGEWVTCACGEQDPRIPRSKGDPLWHKSAPRDSELRDLGIEFAYHVESNNFGDAEYYLDQIERRAAEILAEIDTYRHRLTIQTVDGVIRKIRITLA